MKDIAKSVGKIPASLPGPSIPKPSKAVPVTGGTDEEIHRNTATMAKSPEFAAYRVIRAVEEKSGLDEILDTPAMLAELKAQAVRVNSGDLSEQEAMLANMATALQSLFSRLADRGMHCDQLPAFEGNMRIALRAQSQCRATIETLAMIKNPPIIYARQANIANGPQQVNNGVAPAREIESKPNEQSGATHELLPDTRAQSATVRAHPHLEAVGAVNRAANTGGQDQDSDERVQGGQSPDVARNRKSTAGA